MLHAVDSFGSPDAVGVVGIAVAVEGLELAALFPCQGMAQVVGGVSLLVYPYLPQMSISSQDHRLSEVVG